MLLRSGCIGLTLLAGAVASSAAEPVAGAPVSLSDLCVTDGSLEDAGNGRLRVSAPQMRAVLARPPADAAEVGFVYLGATATRKALGSGTQRRERRACCRAGGAAMPRNSGASRRRIRREAVETRKARQQLRPDNRAA